MLSKEEFIKHIERLKEFDNKLDKIGKVSRDLCMGVVEVSEWLPDTIIRLLCINCNIDPDQSNMDVISWWIYEAKYGTDKYINNITVGDKVYRLKTPEDLYNYINVIYNKEVK